MNIKHSNTRKFLLLLLSLAGLTAYLLAENLKGHGIDNEHLLKVIKEIGGFIAVSCTMHLIYIVLLKSEDLEVIKQTLRDVIDKDRNILQHGLNKISEVDYGTIIDGLKNGDIIYTNDTYLDDIDRIREKIIKAAVDGVKFRFLAIAPHCTNARRRALETFDKPENYSSAISNFIDKIVEIMDQTQSSIEPDPEKRSVDLRIYRNSPGTPIYLIENNKKLQRAFTGFYLCKASRGFIHLEWVGETDSDSSRFPLSENNKILRELGIYFKKKWQESDEYNKTTPWCGKWSYKTIDNNNKQLINLGNCTVQESQGTLKISGTRHTETIIIDGVISEKSCNLWWESTNMVLYTEQSQRNNTSDTHNVNIHVYYNLLPDTGESCRGVMNLKFEESLNDKKISGEYHIYGECSSEHITSRDGIIEFTPL